METKLEQFLKSKITKNDLNIGLEFYKQFGTEIEETYKLLNQNKKPTKTFKIIVKIFQKVIAKCPEYESNQILKSYNIILGSIPMFITNKPDEIAKKYFKELFQEIENYLKTLKYIKIENV